MNGPSAVARFSDARVTRRRLLRVVLPAVVATVVATIFLSGTPDLALLAGLVGAGVVIGVGLVGILFGGPERVSGS